MKFVYLSSGLFGAKVLENLQTKPNLVLTQPDRYGGRGMKQLISTPVKQYCLGSNLGFKQDLEQLDLSSFNFALVADYGVIIQRDLLAQPKFGFYNIHPSLLPKYRGSTPLQTAILNNEKHTGVSIIKMDEKVDHGDLVAQEKVNISVNDTYLTLLKKTAELGAEMFNQLFRQLQFPPTSLKLRGTKQNHQQATYTKKLTKQDGFVKIEQLIPYLVPIFTKYNLLHLLPNKAEKPIDPLKLHNLIRALSPWPGVWSQSSEKTIKIGKLEDKFLSISEVKIKGIRYCLQ